MKSLTKTTISIALTICLILTTITPTFAYEDVSSISNGYSYFLNSIQSDVNNGSVKILENISNSKGVKDIKVKYSNGIIAQIKEKQIGNKVYLDIVEGTLKNKLIIDLESNSIILNNKNVQITSILEAENREDINTYQISPFASWIYNDSPIYGSEENYTRYISYSKHNVNLNNSINNITLTAFVAIISVVLSGGTGIGIAILGVGASAFYEYVSFNDPYTKRVYMDETQYYHKTLNFYKKHFCQYYDNSNYTNAYSDSTFYSGWAGN